MREIVELHDFSAELQMLTNDLGTSNFCHRNINVKCTIRVRLILKSQMLIALWF